MTSFIIEHNTKNHFSVLTTTTNKINSILLVFKLLKVTKMVLIYKINPVYIY